MNQDKEKDTTSNTSVAERLAEKIGISANASHIYGDPVERHGTTVIPVAKAAYGFGGGNGNEGSGGGGGMSLTPVGYIEIKEGTTRFRSIRDPQTTMKIVAIGSLFSFLIAKSITSLFTQDNDYKGKKKNKKKKKKK
ncbi:spore germination protein GerW family protein [Pontibacter cellulosilyticus]|uniref:Sporulation protein YtfJ n=1 Tax=Pontibacter cellulosilyticus TaxID=1720253 RepID=A0A923N5R6_9BACT|nr:spore germination protein GerW family protein [Pontibacter cellulosilyticus]MBC5991981.1 hypothetical protein [Pontibacter cellulosilyticus]